MTEFATPLLNTAGVVEMSGAGSGSNSGGQAQMAYRLGGVDMSRCEIKFRSAVRQRPAVSAGQLTLTNPATFSSVPSSLAISRTSATSTHSPDSTCPPGRNHPATR